jgi:hypothetical protein
MQAEMPGAENSAIWKLHYLPLKWGLTRIIANMKIKFDL